MEECRETSGRVVMWPKALRDVHVAEGRVAQTQGRWPSLGDQEAGLSEFYFLP